MTPGRGGGNVGAMLNHPPRATELELRQAEAAHAWLVRPKPVRRSQRDLVIASLLRCPTEPERPARA